MIIFHLQPMEVYVDDEAKLTLHGLQQHYVKLKDAEKNRKLFELLDVLEFNQVVIFVKSVQRCMALAQLLIEQNFPAIAIHRGMPQEERLSRYQQFKDFQKVSLFFIVNIWRLMGIFPKDIVRRNSGAILLPTKDLITYI